MRLGFELLPAEFKWHVMAVEPLQASQDAKVMTDRERQNPSVGRKLTAAMNKLKASQRTADSILDTETDIASAAAAIAQRPEDLERIQVNVPAFLTSGFCLPLYRRSNDMRFQCFHEESNLQVIHRGKLFEGQERVC